MNADLDHFLNLALRGRYPAASGGEHRAFKLAQAVVEYVPGLDELARDGLCEFIERTAQHPMEARDIFDDDEGE